MMQLSENHPINLRRTGDADLARIVNKHAQALGRLGGKTKGKTKARTREQCQKAAKAMWDKRRAKQP